MTESTALIGMNEITAFLRRSRATVYKYINQYNAPIVKVCGGWESDKILLENWRREMIRRGLNL